MFADSTEELHKLAQKIGLKREWFDGDERLPHYDLTPGKREQALEEGAVEASGQIERECILQNRREK